MFSVKIATDPLYFILGATSVFPLVIQYTILGLKHPNPVTCVTTVLKVVSCNNMRISENHRELSGANGMQ